MVKLHFCFLIAIFVCLSSFVLAQPIQTELIHERNSGVIAIWDFISGSNDTLGKAYSIEDNAFMNVLFYPKEEQVIGKNMVLSGAYTSYDGRIAGVAYNNRCNQIGNINDTLFKPNACVRLIPNGQVSLSFSDFNARDCNSIPVYQVIDYGKILWDIVNNRTSNQFKWRFLVCKNWRKSYVEKDGSIRNERGKDWIIVDFHESLTLSKSCQFILGMQRQTSYGGISFTSWVSACLLDTGAYRPFLLNGKNVHGTFDIKKQSNVIVVE